ncbi:MULTISPECIES: cache domain-containing protein [unclassified Methylococcus]|uniref:cache domain-containing protein n=1 Tax=unclassified Methylococcus TaxID=2618889 RepID=UPI003D7D7B95
MTSIRVVFPLIFALQIFVAVGLTGAIAYVSHMREAQDTAKEILELIGNMIDDQLYRFLSQPIDLTQVYADSLRGRPDLPLDDLLEPRLVKKLSNGVWTQAQMTRWANLSIANSAGQNLRFDRREYGKKVVKVSDIRRGGVIEWRLLENYGKGGMPLEVQEAAYDPRTEAYYRDALAKGGLVVSPIHFSPLLQGSAPVVTVAEPVYDGHGRPRAVVSSDIYLAGIGRYLQNLHLPNSSIAFLFDAEGHLIAGSRGSFPGPTAGRLPLATASSDPIIRATAGYIAERYGFLAVPDAESFRYVRGEQHNYVHTDHLLTDRQFAGLGLDWRLAVVIEESDLIENLITGIHSAAWLSLGLLVLAVAVGSWTAAGMIRPILTLGKVAAALEKDELDARHLDVRQLERDTRWRNEFGELAHVFLRMVQEVRARHDLLEAQLEQLRVNIDEADTQAKIRQISDTEFFADLKAKATRIREERKRAAEPSAQAFAEHDP